MRNFRLLQQIFSERWLIEKSYEQQVTPLILKALLEGTNLDDINQGQNIRLAATDQGGESYGWKLYVIEGNRVRKIDRFSEAAPNAIALLHIDGPIMHRDGWCSMGTETMSKIIKGADESDHIAAIILEVNSPGGQVIGTEQLARTIESIATPTYTYGHLAASAAYWISAASQEIWSSGRSNEFGSIGVMASWRDYSNYFEKLGIKVHEVYATKSEHKNLPFREAQKGNYEPLKEEILDPTYQIFQSEMRRLRGLKDEVLSGRLYLAESALEKGLIDRIGTREQLVAHISNNHFSNTSFSFNKTTMADGSNMVTQFMSLFSSKEAIEALNNDIVKLTEERDDWKSKYEQLQGQHETLQTENTSLQQQLTTVKTERDEWQTKAETYGKQPGQMPTKVTKENGDDIGEEDGFKVNKNATHNQLALQVLRRL